MERYLDCGCREGTSRTVSALCRRRQTVTPVGPVDPGAFRSSRLVVCLYSLPLFRERGSYLTCDGCFADLRLTRVVSFPSRVSATVEESGGRC